MRSTLRAVPANGDSPLFAPRRGVLLLLILALLSMFGLIAVAFVVLTGQAQRSAKSIERIDLVSDPPPKLLQQAAMQIFRGSNNPASVMGAHSLLEDIYGNNTAPGQLAGPVTPICGGQLLELMFTAAAMAEVSRRGGCVLTITGPSSATPGYGQSTRIVGFNPTNGYPQVLAFTDGTIPGTGTVFTINGVPFSGTGFGYDATVGSPTFGTLKDSVSILGAGTCEVALLPNHLTNRNPPGGANSDYTAVDYQHMLLAAQMAHATAPGGMQTIPSFHRPELINYWMNRLSKTTWADLWAMSPDLCRTIMLRPIGAEVNVVNPDHPNFTGSNLSFKSDWDGHSLGSQWDVDNDGDGVADSVWVDLGLPVRSTADGRLYKPLFAILCTDLDGRINVNAHGCLDQYVAAYTAAVSPPPGHAFAGGASPVLPRGVGYGPAEINLLPILKGDATLCTQVLSWRYPASGLGSDLAGKRLSLNKWFLFYGGDYATGLLNGIVNDTGAYGSPPDLLGTAAIGLDWGGRALYAAVGVSVTMGQTYNATTLVACPYEYDLSAKRLRGSNATPGNYPFSVTELERILRPYDRDATSLPARLAQATAPGGNPPDASVLLLNDSSTPPRPRRLGVTTESWDVPSSNAALSTDVLTGGGALPPILQAELPTRHVADVLKVLLMKKSAGLGAAMTAPQAIAALPTLVAPELLCGRKMDLNRAFGNGRDNAGNSVVDQPWPRELSGNDNLSLYNSASAAAVPVTLPANYDPTNGVPLIGAANSLQARQLYARYLYVLATLLADTTALRTQLVGTDEDVARFLAQWAVNVVDFYDRDSIITPFDYDPRFAYTNNLTYAIDPNNPWNPPPNDALHRVWGCERPELLISETLAFHDRRTEDLNNEAWDAADPGDTSTAAGRTTDAAPNNDASFDQSYRPQGSLFVELYNPWTDQEPRPAELCTASNGGVDLKKLTPASSGTQSPVWRMIVVDGPNAAQNPDDPTSPPPIERAVYFVPPGSPLPPDGAVQFQPDATRAGEIAAVLPGRYAVIGPDDITYLGFTSGQNPDTVVPSTTRRIVLDPTGTTHVAVCNDGTNNDLPVSSIQSPVAVIINSPRRLSISEPDTGYPAYTGPSSYSPPIDTPLDADPAVQPSATMRAATQDNRRTDWIKVIHLQRLANPLMPHNVSVPLTDLSYNPYRTIDSMPVDLIAFNGITSAADLHAPTPMTGIDFYGRQRGHNNGSTAASPNLWREETAASSPKQNTNDLPPVIPVASNFVFDRPLNHTLGFLNDAFGVPSGTSTPVGDPLSPFPWLTWNNRPFVSQLELFLVPTTSSWQLCRTFAIPGGDPYGTLSMPFAPFSHLPDLLQSTASNTSGSSAQLHRIVEFVGVPSRFVGTEIQIDPNASFTGSTFYPPFNRVSTYREPGRVNLNTIFSEEVYKGLLNNDPTLGPTWANFQLSRKGDYASNPNNCPTEYAQPFRSFGGANMVPLNTLQANREVNATLLREGAAGHPLFEFISTQPANDTSRNPFFYYHALQRLGNLVTTRSNVYAVWITVGYFEVETPPSGANPANYPDGYALSRELGVDTGEIERHRAFYIFDRTIPVGFQRGQDLNVEKAILVNRYIE